MTPTDESRSSLIRLKLVAQGLGDLYPLLRDLKGLTLGERFVLREIYTVGGQSVLWFTDDLSDPSSPALTRTALLPYHRPAYIKDADINRVRTRIEREASLMEQFAQTSLPRLKGIFHAPNPLHSSERGAEIVEREPYLVMEWIRGWDVAQVARTIHAGIVRERTRRLGALAFEIARVFAEFSYTLLKAGYLYTDLNPKNLLVPRSPSEWKIRIVDAGSILPVSATPNLDIPFTLSYVPPDFYETTRAGQLRWPTEQFVLYTLGKTLWQILTNRQPMPGEDSDLRDKMFLQYPEELKTLVSDLIRGECRGLEELAILVEAISPTDTG